MAHAGLHRSLPSPQARPARLARRTLAGWLRTAAGHAGPAAPGHPGPAPELERLALRHRVAPLLHRACEEGRLEGVPDALRARLQAAYHGALRKNVVALALGEGVLERLARAGVRAEPLKGWALVEGPLASYPDPGLRPMDDLDLMVRRGDVARAADALEEEGFRLVTGVPQARLEGGHELAFHRPVAGLHLFVELHWAWAGRESLLRALAVSGERFLALRDAGPPGSDDAARAAHALFVAVHAARHAFARWIWLVDLHRLLADAPPSTWRALEGQARALRARRPLWVALHETQRRLGTPLPAGLLRRLAPGPFRGAVIRTGMARAGEAPGAAGRVAKLLLGESWSDVARTAAWALAPGRAWWQERRGVCEPGTAATATADTAGGGAWT